MDSTHRKANANKNKYEDMIVEQVKKKIFWSNTISKIWTRTNKNKKIRI